MGRTNSVGGGGADDQGWWDEVEDVASFRLSGDPRPGATVSTGKEFLREQYDSVPGVLRED